MNNIEKEELDEFLQWKKDNGKFEYKLTDIYVNDNGEIKTEKKIAMIIKRTPNDWKEFCRVTGKKCISEATLLVIY